MQEYKQKTERAYLQNPQFITQIKAFPHQIITNKSYKTHQES